MATINGSSPNRTLAGTAADDTFRPFPGSTIGGGGGFDTLDYSGAPGGPLAVPPNPVLPVTVDLAAGTTTYGGAYAGITDRFSGISEVEGSAGADTLSGGGGGGFVDTLEGMAGNDTLIGVGQTFTVAASYEKSPAAVYVNLTTGQAQDGFGGTDTLVAIHNVRGSAFDDTLLGGAGADRLVGRRGNDTLDGGQGLNQADYFDSPGAVTVNLSAGTASDGHGTTDTLRNIQNVGGSPFGDTLRGNGAANTLLGRGGDDVLEGGNGTDILDGGEGRDAVDMTAFGLRTVTISRSGADLVAVRATQADLLRDIEEVRFLDGRLVMDADDPAAKVLRLYQAALGRDPDQGGLNYWIDRLQQGASLSQLGAGILSSPEVQAGYGGLDDAGYVDRLYQNMLGRAGDEGGRAFWIGRLQAGVSRAEVLVGFSESAENKAATAGVVSAGIWDRSEAAQQVARLYDTALDRMPDAAGLGYWRGRIESGSASLSNVAQAFTSGAEFTARYGGLSNADFVQALYQNTLGRPGDAGGTAYWTGQLDAGTLSRSAVVLGLSESRENVAATASLFGGEDPSSYGVALAAITLPAGDLPGAVTSGAVLPGVTPPTTV